MNKTFLLTTTAATLWSSSASAELISIGSAILTGLAGTGAVGSSVALALFSTVGVTGVGLAAVGAGLALQYALTPRPSVPTPDAITNTTDGQPGPGRHAFGRYNSAGVAALGRTDGYFLHRNLLTHFEELDGVEAWLINDVESVVDVDGTVLDPPWAKQNGSYLKIEFQVGDGNETAWPKLVAAYDDYTTNHRARGIAQVLVTAENPGSQNPLFGKLYQGGFPDVSYIGRALHPLDPRNNQSVWSENACLIALHYFRQISGYSDTLIDFGKMGDCADACDVTTTTTIGDVPARRLGGGFEGNVTVDVCLELMRSAGIKERYNADGSVYFYVQEDYPDAELTFPWQHVLTWDWNNGPEGVDRPNYCRVKYYSPEQNYKVAEIPGIADLPWGSDTDDIARYGEFEQEIALQFCPDSGIAQRIARRLFHMGRANKVSFTTSFAGMALERGMCIDLEIDTDGFDGVETLRCIVDDIIDNDDSGTCEVTVTVIPDILKTPFNPVVDEAPPAPFLASTQLESEIDAPNAVTDASAVALLDNSDQFRMVVDHVSGAVNVQVLYNLFDANDLPLPAQISDNAVRSGDDWLVTVDDDLVGEKVRLRARAINADNELSPLSGEIVVDPVTIDNSTPAAPIISGGVEGSTWNITCEVPQDLAIVGILFETRQWNSGEPVPAFQSQPPADDVAPLTTYSGSIISGGFDAGVSNTAEIRARFVTSDDSKSAYSNTLTVTGTA